MFFNGFNRMYFNETELRKALDDYDVNMSVKPVIHREKRWNLWGGLYYAGTIYTTIGYGDMVAVTFWGRVLTMFYASIGIPLVITILNDWGTVMFHVADELWKDIVIPVIHILKKSLHSESYSGSQEGNYDRFTQTSSSELPNDSDAIQPMPLFLVVVGFGDITPRHTVAVANFLLILVGLSVVSMAINVVQMQLEFLFSRIVKLIDKDFKASLCVSTDEMKKVTYEADDVQSISSMVQQQKGL
ncbi:Ion channel [Dictyocaulus viviparus]|uniref:Ion channel n=1 Tax=Dictyocaulus viviparus TaxID=29172 RepID=A0A0D8Y7P0_DICVI|nr:Ion channel [Dictyocaulus viviparus]